MRKRLVYFVTFLVLFLLSIKIVYADEGVTYLYEVTGAHIETHVEMQRIQNRMYGVYTTVCNKFEGCTYSLETTQSVVSLASIPGVVGNTKILIDKRSFIGGYLYPRVLGKLQESAVYINDVARGTFRIMYLKKDPQGFDWYSVEIMVGDVHVLKSIEKRKGDVNFEEVIINQFGNITYKKLIKDPGI
jgi:hypothetical protein